MFREELEDLKNVYMGRFNIVHILESESADIELFSGQLTAKNAMRCFRAGSM